MTDTKAITDALDVLTACTGNGGIPTDEQIDRINAAARSALAALLAERDKLRTGLSDALHGAIASMEFGTRLDWGDLNPFARVLGFKACSDFIAARSKVSA